MYNIVKKNQVESNATFVRGLSLNIQKVLEQLR